MLKLLRTNYIMYKLCVLLKVLILMKADIAFSSEDLEESDGISIFTVYYNAHKDINDLRFFEIENYIDSVTVRNEVENIPSEPIFLRGFVEFENRLMNEEGHIFIILRWNKPEFTNGIIQEYTLQYWYNIINRERTVHIVHHISSEEIYIKLPKKKLFSTIYFQIQAHNEVGAGPYTKFINVSTIHENPVPILLFNLKSGTKMLDIDFQSASIDYGSKQKEIIYSALEQKIYCINQSSDLISWNFDISLATYTNYTRIIYLDNSAHNLCIDWIARNLYWIQLKNKTRSIMKLDLTLWQIGIAKYYSILKINESTFLNILPSQGYIYWIEFNLTNQYVIRQANLDGKNVKSLSEDNNNKCSCPYKLLRTSSMKIENTNIDDEPLMYWTLKNHLIMGDIYNCKCNLILSADNQTIFNYLTIDRTNIYLFSNSEQLFYILNKKYAFLSLESKENAFIHVQKAHYDLFPINSVIAFDGLLQPYPRTMCLVPKIKNYRIKVITTTTNSIVVKLPEPKPNDGCKKYHLATTIYNISISCVNNNFKEFKEFSELTHELNYEIPNLTPFTEYRIKLALRNFYFDKLSMDLQFGEDVIQKTDLGKFNAPENVTVQVLTPALARIYWTPPKNQNCAHKNYEVHWIPVLFSNGTQKITYEMQNIKPLFNELERTVDGKFFTTIRSFLPGQEYLIYVRVYPASFNNFFTDSLRKSFKMYPEPNNLILNGVSTNDMNISWILSVNIISYKLEYKNATMQEWKIAHNIKKNIDKVIHYIENLQSDTLYNFRLILKYSECMEYFIWPPDGRFFTFNTLANTTNAPGKPIFTRLPNSMYQLKWKPAQVYDSQVILYRLEGLIVENNFQENRTYNWKLYYTGTDNHWVIKEGMKQKYLFRVQAGNNAYGFGKWSETSAVVDLTESVELLTTYYYYLPLVLSLIVIFVIYNVYYFYRSYGQRKEINDQTLPTTITDIELVTRNEMSFEYIQLDMLLDSRLQRNLDKFNLKIIEKNRVTFTKFIGSGEFGKVFQGSVKNLEESGSMPVAIKMLRENASSLDKEKFLQEAELMNRFRHKHVLRLLGICLNTDSTLIILELMEGGDLLNYLRESRTLQSSDPNSLRLQDLLAMCEDVARGCCYLEKLRFVHRDLACRNCLISSKNRKTRIVKIGDFGLAKDIYQNDYYRVKGEHRLPVRWMAPESLMFRKFTSQSDVWAFGVLMWEIMSLGEHPYSVKGNSEILEYVCTGGKLQQPLNCPPILYELMQRCWNAEEDRPNFILCLENIVILRNNIEDATLTVSSADIIKYAERN